MLTFFTLVLVVVDSLGCGFGLGFGQGLGFPPPMTINYTGCPDQKP
jgi:hypothetical protein